MKQRTQAKLALPESATSVRMQSGAYVNKVDSVRTTHPRLASSVVREVDGYHSLAREWLGVHTWVSSLYGGLSIFEELSDAFLEDQQIMALGDQECVALYPVLWDSQAPGVFVPDGQGTQVGGEAPLVPSVLGRLADNTVVVGTWQLDSAEFYCYPSESVSNITNITIHSLWGPTPGVQLGIDVTDGSEVFLNLLIGHDFPEEVVDGIRDHITGVSPVYPLAVAPTASPVAASLAQSSHDEETERSTSLASVHCPSCQAVVPQGDRYCGECGSAATPAKQFSAAVADPSLCPECGTVVSAQGRFCGKCGCEVRQPGTENVDRRHSEPEFGGPMAALASAGEASAIGAAQPVDPSILPSPEPTTFASSSPMAQASAHDVVTEASAVAELASLKGQLAQEEADFIAKYTGWKPLVLWYAAWAALLAFSAVAALVQTQFLVFLLAGGLSALSGIYARYLYRGGLRRVWFFIF